MPKYKTNYNGLIVNENVKNQLINQSIKNFLRVEKKGEEYFLQQKLPEHAIFNNKEFNPRKGLNAFSKVIGQLIVDKNGSINIDNARANIARLGDVFAEVDEVFTPTIYNKPEQQEKILSRLVNTFNIPNNEKENLKNFLLSNTKNLVKITDCIENEVIKFGKFQSMINNYKDLDESKKLEYKNYINSNMEDYKNLYNNFINLKNIDIKNENKIILPLDCELSSAITESTVNSFNNYCDKFNLEDDKVIGKREKLKFSLDDLDNEAKDYNFEFHYVYFVDAKIDEEDVKITFESTAPPACKYFFCPKEQRTGLGIYESIEDCKDYYESINIEDKVKLNANNENDNLIDGTAYPVLSDNEIEALKPSKPNAFYAFCHKYFGFFQSKFDKYNEKLSFYNAVKESNNNLSNIVLEDNQEDLGEIKNNTNSSLQIKNEKVEEKENVLLDVHDGEIIESDNSFIEEDIAPNEKENEPLIK